MSLTELQKRTNLNSNKKINDRSYRTDLSLEILIDKKI